MLLLITSETFFFSAVFLTILIFIGYNECLASEILHFSCQPPFKLGLNNTYSEGDFVIV